jgi:hypothetical protein
MSSRTTAAASPLAQAASWRRACLYTASIGPTPADAAKNGRSLLTSHSAAMGRRALAQVLYTAESFPIERCPPFGLPINGIVASVSWVGHLAERSTAASSVASAWSPASETSAK